MDPVIAVSLTLAVVGLAALLAVVLRSASGRARRGDGPSFAPGDLPGLVELGRNGTLVQFSTEFCGTCPGTRRLLTRVSAQRDGIAFLDVDLTHDPALASRLHILQTPTVFVLDARGGSVSRFGGSPRPDELAAALDTLSPLSPAR